MWMRQKGSAKKRKRKNKDWWCRMESIKKITIAFLLFFSITVFIGICSYINLKTIETFTPLSIKQVTLKFYPCTKRLHDIATIYQNPDMYPEELRILLSGNADTFDFVYAYPKKKGKLFSDTLGNITKGEFPYLLQWDERWGYASYGDNMIAINGCAPTTLSMVIAGLTGRSDVTPYTVAKYSESKGYYVAGVGTSWNLLDDVGSFGITNVPVLNTYESISASLTSHHPIICSMLPGDFTKTGHFILLYGMQDGDIKVYDPNSISRSEKLWSYDAIKDQIAELWCYQEIGF